MLNHFIKSMFFILLLSALSSACNPLAVGTSQAKFTSAPMELLPGSSNTQSPANTPSPSQTTLPSTTSTATITPTNSATASATPTLHPMHILAARQTPYPGSPITIEETLPSGSNYDRFIASYLSEGNNINGLLTIPQGEMPATGWPAIVFNHGYIPPDEYQTTERYVAYVDSLARNGYIVYKIDYRGHGQSEGDASGAYGDPGYTVDVLNAVAAIKEFPQADGQRIGMWGHSMGGFLTLRSMTISKDIQAGVIWAGVVASYPDLICCWRLPTPGVPTRTPNPNFRSGWRTRWQELYGSTSDNPDFWMGISANSYLDELSGPVQLHHGTADTEVPIKFSQDLYQQVQAAGIPVEFYSYEADNHNLSGFFSLAMQRTNEFFDRYVKNGE